MNLKGQKFNTLLIALAIFGMALVLSVPVHAEQQSKTLENLQAAYNGESNAQAKYLAYAQKADEEGYHKAARLFRAVASAEEIHLKNHARVIKGMGAVPKADIQLPEVKSTRENLQDAIKGETYEKTTMYPEFISQAQKDNNQEAVLTFTYAQNVEAQHAKLYKEAVDNLENWKTANEIFYVCPTCGYTVEGKPSFSNCPFCATPSGVFLMIS